MNKFVMVTTLLPMAIMPMLPWQVRGPLCFLAVVGLGLVVLGELGIHLTRRRD